MNWTWVNGKVIQGHRVASGLAEDTPYEDGSVVLQAPFFKERGVDISPYYPGTVNVDISPLRPERFHYDTTLHEVPWHSSIPPETFSFLSMQLKFRDEIFPGLLYYPHADTKPSHYTPTYILEVFAPWIENLNYRDEIEAAYPEGAVEMKS